MSSSPSRLRGKAWHSCPHCTSTDGQPKRLYDSKTAAKRVRRIMREKWMYVYRCPVGGNGFHLGHLPGVTRRGEATRTEVYGG